MTICIKNSITMYISLYLCVFFALKSVYYTLCTHYIELLYIFWSACAVWCADETVYKFTVR